MDLPANSLALVQEDLFVLHPQRRPPQVLPAQDVAVAMLAWLHRGDGGKHRIGLSSKGCNYVPAVSLFVALELLLQETFRVGDSDAKDCL